MTFLKYLKCISWVIKVNDSSLKVYPQCAMCIGKNDRFDFIHQFVKGNFYVYTSSQDMQ